MTTSLSRLTDNSPAFNYFNSNAPGKIRQTVAAAGAIQSQGLVVAPGTAAYSTAAAHIATLESNAHIQKMIASALRLEAARLGHDTMTVKRSATFTRESRSKTTELNR